MGKLQPKCVTFSATRSSITHEPSAARPSGQLVDIVDAWRRHRPYLINLGYQITGDVGAAEDVAQEAFLRLSRVDPNEIDDVRGWLTVVTSRLCLDQVRSARVRYERPDPGHLASETLPDKSPHLDPADRVTLDDEIHTALLEVLRRLSPAERVAFVLHDVFGVRSTRSPRPWGARWAPAVSSPGARGPSSAPPTEVERGAVRRTSARHREIHHRVRQRRIFALTAVLDPTVWGVGTILADPAPPPQVNHGPHNVAPTCCGTWGRESPWSSLRPDSRCCWLSRTVGFSAYRADRRGPTGQQDRGDRRSVGAGRLAALAGRSVAPLGARREIRHDRRRDLQKFSRVAGAISLLTSITPPGRRCGSNGTWTTGRPCSTNSSASNERVRLSAGRQSR